MHFYAARWDGVGSDADPFVPRGTDRLPKGVGWSALDLRPDPSQPGGFCFMATPQSPPGNLPAGVVYLGENPAEIRESLVDLIVDRFPALAGRMRDDLPPGRRTLRDIVAYLLVEVAGDIGLNPLRPELVDGVRRLRVWLGGLLVDQPVVAGGATYTDDFNRANETLESSANWEKILSGSASVTGNEVVVDSLDCRYRYTQALDSDDHYCQIVRGTYADEEVLGPIVRMASGATWTGYWTRYRGGIRDRFELFRVVAGSFTLLGTSSESNPTGSWTLRGEADGSTIRVLFNGVERVSATDTGITGNTLVGFMEDLEAGGTFDSFETGDLGAAPPPSGGASGSVNVSGQAAGSRAASGGAAGTVALGGQAAGSRDSSGTTDGTVELGGQTAGSRPSSGTTDGTVELGGQTAGTRSSSGTADGTVELGGQAAGTAPVVGGASGGAAGTVALGGQAAGTRGATGTADGTVELDGQAAGSRGAAGGADGTVVLSGQAVGDAPVPGEASGGADGTVQLGGQAAGSRGASGTAAGAVQLGGQAAGSRTSAGAADGIIVLSGQAAGTAPVPGEASGGAAGTVGLSGQTVGARTSAGTADGIIVLSGRYVGAVTVAGAAAGTVVLAGAAGGAGIPDLFYASGTATSAATSETATSATASATAAAV